MKKLLLLLVFPIFLFSQEKILHPAYTTIQIDSIAEINGNSLFDSSGSITITKKRNLFGSKTIGQGFFSNSVFYTYPEGYKNLSANDKKLRINGEYIIKASYHQTIKFKDRHQEILYAEFYYRDKILIFTRLTKKIIKKNTTTKEDIYNIINLDEIDSKIVNSFDFNIKEWINEKNKEYLHNSLY